MGQISVRGGVVYGVNMTMAHWLAMFPAPYNVLANYSAVQPLMQTSMLLC